MIGIADVGAEGDAGAVPRAQMAGRRGGTAPHRPARIKVVGYVRVSTEEQAGSGVSLASQASKLGMYAELHDLEMVALIEDPGASAKSLERPGLARALAMLDSGEAEGLVVAKLDRLTRNVADLAGLLDDYFGERAGRQLFSVGDAIDTRTAAGRLVLNVLMSVSQWEREVIVERTRDAMRHKRSKAERLGTIPYGRDLGPDGKTLVANPEEEAALALMADLAGRGWTLRAIAAELDLRGYRPKGGGSGWRHSTVGDILKRSRGGSAA